MIFFLSWLEIGWKDILRSNLKESEFYNKKL